MRASTVCVIAISLCASAPLPGGERPPWTSSRVRGSPDPAPPYAVEVAFPGLRFKEPVILARAPGTDRLLAGEQAGRIYSFPPRPDVGRADPFFDLRAREPEALYLYGLAFHPRFEANRQAFLCYVLREGLPNGSRVSRFVATRDEPPRLVPESEDVLLTWPSGGHNGGCLELGPDGMLYISTGDGVGPNPPDTLDTGQDLDDLLSCVLRIDVDRAAGGLRYAVPPDNPFHGVPGARPEIWAYGFRNPWKMSFDPISGDLLAGDVGWDLWELVHRVERGGNHGWSAMEGRRPVRADLPRGPTPIVPPLVEHPHTEAASITGGCFYGARRLAELRGAYVYGDYVTGKIWGLRQEEGRVTWLRELADTQLQVVAFGADHEGEVYVADHTTTGKIYRLVRDARGAEPARFPERLSETGLFASTRDLAPAPGVVRYEVAAEPWADGVTAERLLGIPGEGRIDPASHEHWAFPEGTVIAKTLFASSPSPSPGPSPGPGAGRGGGTGPGRGRRLETQILHFEAGTWRPYAYAWDEGGADATLVAAGGARGRGGWTHSSRAECGLCHGLQAGFVLGVNTYQLHRDVAAGGSRGSQLRALERLGVLARPLADPPARLPRLADPYDEREALDLRARSYLHSNCAPCHFPNGGGMSPIQLTAWTPLEAMEVLGARPRWGGFGLDEPRIVAPGEPCRSVLLYRVSKSNGGRMPRLGSRLVDDRGVRLLRDWIAALPVDPVGPGDGPRLAAEARSVVDALERGGGSEGGDGNGGSDGSGAAEGLASSVRSLAASTRGALALAVALGSAGAVPERAAAAAAGLLRDHPRPEVRDLFERFLPESERSERLGDGIDPERILALAGDVDRGRSVFLGDAGAQCKSCHRAGGEGARVGPDLSGVGRRLSAQEILQSILEPSRSVAPELAAYAVVTRSGQAITGIIAERSEAELVLLDARGDVQRVDASDVAKLERQAASLMPEGLLRGLTPQEAADLVAFLASIKG
ncbi:MAG: PQQ-dependent sugar dehydrogenase [Planctomycetes bacterium]|nr:PQQ-dependent sugar dehydrogenase [Planctomycetota bacterium]